MNYIKELNAFAAYRQYNKLSPGQIALWLAIIEAHNAHGWSEWVTLAASVLEQATGLKPEGIRTARTALVKRGLIEHRAHGTNAPDYRIVPLSEKNEIKNDQANTEVNTVIDTQGNTQVDTEVNTQVDTVIDTQVNTVINTEVDTALNKLNINKTKVNKDNILPPYNPPAEESPKKKKTAKKAKRDVFAEYAEDDLKLLQALRDYEAHRDGMKTSFSTDRARELACRKLDELSGGDSATKIAIIEQSILRGWQGLFELKGDRRPSAPAEAKKAEKTSRYDYAEIRRRDRERLKRLAEEEI